MNRRMFLKGIASCLAAPAMAPIMKLAPAPMRLWLSNWTMRELDDGTRLMTVQVNCSKEWCMGAAEAEGDHEIGAGLLARDPLI